jgi:hypothetical protein
MSLVFESRSLKEATCVGLDVGGCVMLPATHGFAAGAAEKQAFVFRLWDNGHHLSTDSRLCRTNALEFRNLLTPCLLNRLETNWLRG